MKPYYEDDLVKLYHGDCLDVLRAMPDCSVDAVVTDPPYGLEFMGKEWDGADGFRRSLNPNDAGRDNAFGRSSRTSPEYRAGALFQEWCEAWTAECLRVLKPGGHLLAFGGTRTWHRLACAVEDAGFEVRDSIAWMYGSGFSKGGLLGNRAGIEWCACERGNAIPYDHASNDDLLGLRNNLHPAPVTRGEGQDADMLTAVQREAPRRRVGEARPQGSGGVESGNRSAGSRGDARRSESRLEGRDVHRAGQGLSDGADAGSPALTGERLRGRAPAGDGVADRAAGDASRGGAPHQPGSGGQSAGEPDPLPGPHVALDDGALRGCPECSRCGGLDPAFRGFSTTLKPAFEPVVVARKPLSGTVAANVLAHGTGALNVDGCRVGDEERVNPPSGAPGANNYRLEGGDGRDVENARAYAERSKALPPTTVSGRWPANVILDESQAAVLDEMSGESTSPSQPVRQGGRRMDGGRYGSGSDRSGQPMREGEGVGYGDNGGASRFFYVAKADASERVRVDGIAHPTVKPLALMRWLVRLVTPPGGTILEPFAGSGTTVEACLLEGFHCVAIEREADYLPLIVQRINRRRDPVAAVKAAGDDAGLFDLLDGGVA